MTAFDVYLFTRLDSIKAFFEILSLIIGIFGGGLVLWALLIGFIEKIDTYKQIGYKAIKYCLPLFVFCLFTYGLIPTTKEYAAIYLIPRIVNNEQAQQIPENAIKLLNGKLQEWIADVEGRVNGKE